MSEESIASLLQEAIGVDPTTMGASTITQAAKTLMPVAGVGDLAAYAARLRESPEELAALIEAVVVPETWFFRDAEAYAALAQIVTQEWLPAHPGENLRILSAPCSTGEEPYSIAMTLLEAGLDAGRFTILGVDISTRALEQARRAVYRENSFRGGNAELRKRYFRAGAKGDELAERARERVRFARANLVAADFLGSAAPFHFIFCRNVLIYFDAARQGLVLGHFERLLARGGTLFVGAAEAFLTRSAGFRNLDFPSAFACRKGGQPSAAPPPAWAPPPQPKPALPAPRKAPEPRAQPAPAPAEPAADWTEARRLADAGELPPARQLCEELLSARGGSADGFCLLGLVRDALGETEGAAECYRKALYLEPDHRETLDHLALLLERSGDGAGARRLQARARRQTEEASP